MTRLKPAIITCSGSVLVKPRIVRQTDKIRPDLYCSFVFKFNELLYPSESINRINQRIEPRILSLLETDQVYTDQDGVIKHFEKPDRSIWWVEITGLNIQVLPERDEPKPVIPVGPIIEGEGTLIPVEPEDASPLNTDNKEDTEESNKDDAKGD